MQIIKPNATELIQTDVFKHIEICGRTCYKSEDKITEDSCYNFVSMLRDRNHGAMLEHGTVYLIIPECAGTNYEIFRLFQENNYTKIIQLFSPNDGPKAYITTNYRVIVENDLENIMNQFQSECTEHHYKRRTFKITCNRGVSHEFVRHRVFSFAQESQRYVNYSKDKFGSEIRVIDPVYFSKESQEYSTWYNDCLNAESSYMTLLMMGASPQQAREVLPNATATELIMTGFESDWKHFFDLRCAKDAHPQAQEVANIIKEQF